MANLCACGCGETAKSTFLRGHNNRSSTPEYVVEDRGYVSPCWIWQLRMTHNGYGMATFQGKTTLAHRKVFIEQGHEIPDGLQLDHLCKVRPCVNPDHLEPVTCSENARRRKPIRIDEAMAKTIKSLVGGRGTIRPLAEQFGISQASVRAIRDGIHRRFPYRVESAIGLRGELKEREK